MIRYFQVIKSRRDYKGERYFKVDLSAEKVIQVTVNQGEQKLGRANCFGIGLIAKITFNANYLSMGFVEECSKLVYESKHRFVLKMLS